MKNNIIYINSESLYELVFSIFKSLGSEKDEADIIAEHLVESNLVGHDSHGVIRIPKYLEQVLTGKVYSNRHAKINLEKQSEQVEEQEFKLHEEFDALKKEENNSWWPFPGKSLGNLHAIYLLILGRGPKN